MYIKTQEFVGSHLGTIVHSSHCFLKVPTALPNPKSYPGYCGIILPQMHCSQLCPFFFKDQHPIFLIQ